MVKLDVDPLKIKPTGNLVLVKQNQKQKETESGIILKQYTMTSGETYKQHFTVIAVGPEVNDVAVGDIVHINWEKEFSDESMANRSFRLNQKEDQYFFFKESSIDFIWSEYPVFN